MVHKIDLVIIIELVHKSHMGIIILVVRKNIYGYQCVFGLRIFLNGSYLYSGYQLPNGSHKGPGFHRAKVPWFIDGYF